jgi:ribosome maturation protein SDO1
MSEPQIARIEKKGERFEIFVDPQLAYEFKMGARKDFANILAAEEVFKDARKGERHTQATLQKAFGTTDVNEIALQIIREGEVPITTEQKRKLAEEKQAKVVALIARTCTDPRTKAPIPPQRILAAMEQKKVHVDPFKQAEEQAPQIVEALREVMPISYERIKIAIKVPGQYAVKAYGLLKEYGIKREEWAQDGSLIAMLEMPAGMQPEFYDRLNKLTAGNVETKVVS